MIASIITNATLSVLLTTTSFVPTARKSVSADAGGVQQEIQSDLNMPHSPERIRYRKVMVTAYSSTVDQTDSSPFITANNTVVYDGIVAANFLVFGSRVRFPSLFGDKEFVVADRMNERYAQRIDIWMPSRAQAKKFGVQFVEVEILPQDTLIAYR